MSYPLDKDETIDSIAAQCGTNEQSKGFRRDWELADELERIAAYVVDLPQEEATVLREAADALRNNYVGMKIALTMSELGEAIETLRDHGVKGLMAGKGNFGEELADAHIRMWSLEDTLNIHSGRQVTDKISKNKDRPMMHGRLR